MKQESREKEERSGRLLFWKSCKVAVVSFLGRGMLLGTMMTKCIIFSFEKTQL